MSAMACMSAATAQSMTRNFNFPNFDAISLSGAMNVTLIQSNIHSIAITADRELIDKVTVSVAQGKLSLSLNTSRLTARQKRMLKNSMIRANITMPILTGMEMWGAIQLSTVGDFHAQNLICQLNGSSQISNLSMTASTTHIEIGGASSARISGNLGEVAVKVSGVSQAIIDAAADTLMVDAGGASQIRLTGNTARIVISTSGASQINAGNLIASVGSVSASGASSATVHVKESLRVSAGGTSSVSYIGNPRLDTGSVSRGATIRRKNF